jgi:uncharacterized protein involved in oxidation of intracellular sulfur
MKLGIVLYSTDPESAWNAFRLGVYARQQGDTVTVFLLAKGVECEALDSERFPVRAQMQELVDQGGAILACGTCLKLRQREGTELCPLSTLKDLYELVRDSDRVISI